MVGSVSAARIPRRARTRINSSSVYAERSLATVVVPRLALPGGHPVADLPKGTLRPDVGLDAPVIRPRRVVLVGVPPRVFEGVGRFKPRALVADALEQRVEAWREFIHVELV